MANGSETATATGASDIRENHWLLRAAPPGLRPYLRIARHDRPIGIWLLLFPCWWSIALASGAEGRLPPLDLMILFAIGAVVMRGAGCTINDIADREIDARVARTATRPLPSGQVSPLRALVFLALQLLAGLLVLLQLNGVSIWLGIASLIPVAVYPFMKRVTYWPQAWLGLTFNWGALMGWAAVTGGLGWPALLLYLGGIVWTLGYDTVYAHQDKEDDALIGVKSTALMFGAATKTWVAAFYAAAAVLFLAAGLAAGLGPWLLPGIAAIALLFAWQIRDLSLDDPRDCLIKFRNNRWVGWLLLATFVVASL